MRNRPTVTYSLFQSVCFSRNNPAGEASCVEAQSTSSGSAIACKISHRRHLSRSNHSWIFEAEAFQSQEGYIDRVSMKQGSQPESALEVFKKL